MKTLYPNPSADHSTRVNAIRKSFFLSLLFIILTGYAYSTGTPTLSFKSYKLESGTAGNDGAVYRFSLVDSKMDALVKIKGRSDALVYLANFDLTSAGFDQAFQPIVGYDDGTAPGPVDWWMEFEISFVETGKTTPITVNNFDLTAIDIDGNGDKIREYVSFYGLSSYMLETNSILTLSNITQVVGGVTTTIGKRFDGPTLNFKNIDTSGTAVMVTTSYLNTNKFSVRTGGVATARNGASERMYSLYFKDFTYQDPTQITLDAKLKSFNATLSSTKAILNWVSLERDMSHYVVQRSKNGRDFDDVTMIFANSGSSDQASYSFTDNLTSVTGGLVYYRLKMVNAQGGIAYSAIKIIRLSGIKADQAFSAYPNPAASELRITIPPSWQNKAVTYDMFNVNGQIVKHFQNSKASQTETFQLGNMNAGVYTIRLSNGTESSSQRIIKSDK